MKWSRLSFLHPSLPPKSSAPSRSLVQTIIATATQPLHSVNNPRVKAARALLKRRQRDKEQKMLLEGHRLVLDAIESGIAPRTIFYTEGAIERQNQGTLLQRAINRFSTNSFMVTDQIMALSTSRIYKNCSLILRVPSPLETSTGTVRNPCSLSR